MSRLSEDENDRRAKKQAEQITLHDLERVRLSRGTLAEMTASPAFEEYVVGQSRSAGTGGRAPLEARADPLPSRIAQVGLCAT